MSRSELTPAQWRTAQAHPGYWAAYERHKRRMAPTLPGTEAYALNPSGAYVAMCRQAEELAAREVLCGAL